MEEYDEYPMLTFDRDEVCQNPRYLLFLNIADEFIYGVQDGSLMELMRNMSLNEIIENMLIKSSKELMTHINANELCVQKKPELILVDRQMGISYVHKYITVH